MESAVTHWPVVSLVSGKWLWYCNGLFRKSQFDLDPVPSYEERAKCLETIIQQHTEQTTFEDFAANVFAPVLPPNGTSKYTIKYI